MKMKFISFFSVGITSKYTIETYTEYFQFYGVYFVFNLKIQLISCLSCLFLKMEHQTNEEHNYRKRPRMDLRPNTRKNYCEGEGSSSSDKSPSPEELGEQVYIAPASSNSNTISVCYTSSVSVTSNANETPAISPALLPNDNINSPKCNCENDIYVLRIKQEMARERYQYEIEMANINAKTKREERTHKFDIEMAHMKHVEELYKLKYGRQDKIIVTLSQSF